MFKFAFLALAVVGLSACHLIGLDTNIPIFSSSPNYSLEIINLSEYDLEISVNGSQVTFGQGGEETPRLNPGQRTALRLSNWSEWSSEISVSLTALKKDRVVGATYGKLHVYRNGAQSNVWRIYNEHFDRQKSWPW
ncbi:MAG: hypothetical protein AAB885_02660 [Patescibacteria group bacterium]